MTNQSPFECEVSVEPPGQICVLTLKGKLDALASEEFEVQINRHFQTGHRKFVLDVTALDYVGSLGLRVFVGLHNRLNDGGGLCFCGLSPNIRSIFTVTRLDRLLRSYPTRADAIDAAKSW